MIPLEYMPPLMFCGLVVFMLFGYPVAFSLSAVGLFFAFFSIEWGYFNLDYMQAIPGRVFGSILSNDLLLAIPFFTFMGAILEKCGLAEDMLDSMGQLFGPVRGGLGYSVIIVGFILGAITGTVAAQVIAMTLISLPVMMRYKYNMRYATGVLAASGTITQLVPPSLVLVVLADQLGKSVGDMYLGAWGPSLLQILLFTLYTFGVSIIKPEHVPAVPKADRTLNGWALWKKCLWGIVPSAVLIFLVLGTMMFGIATPTEAGAMGAVGAIVLAVIRHPQLGKFGKISFIAGVIGCFIGIAVYNINGNPTFFGPKGLLFQIFFGGVLYLAIGYLLVRSAFIPELRRLLIMAYQSTARLTAMVAFILVGSTCFSIVFQGVDGGRWIEHLLTSLPGGSWGFLIVINLLVFFLAFFLDFFEIAFIIVPMIAPVAQKLLAPVVGEDAALIWFGVMLCVNMQTSFMHPPFGFALFYMRGVAPKEVKSSDIYWGAVPWVLLQVVMVAIVIFIPASVTGLLDKQQKIDLDKVKIEVPQENFGNDNGFGSGNDDPSTEIQKELGGSAPDSGGAASDSSGASAPAPADVPKGAAPADAPKSDAAPDKGKDAAADAIEKSIRDASK
ncbi:MAG TPA: TRAP transporter large permease subunit [Burkholderiales bacterium]|jgi:TRAP-type mannitol/chloroaromatic compound transport system permease large subunit